MPRWPRSTSRVRPPVWRAQVEAQRQRVQVAEHLERDLAHRALRHLGEQELAQLGEQRRRQRAAGRRRRAARAAPRAAPCCAVEAVDDLLQQQRHADVRDLRRAPGRRAPPSTRPLYSHRYGSSVRIVAPVAARACAATDAAGARGDAFGSRIGTESSIAGERVRRHATVRAIASPDACVAELRGLRRPRTHRNHSLPP